jgi:parvulin-like peptidyl-prolyl isomerase
VCIAGVAAEPEKTTKPIAEKTEGTATKTLDYIAIVNGVKVPMGQYVAALRKGVRERFYHGKVEEGEAKKFRKEIAEELIERALLVQEAKRRKLIPNSEEVELYVKAFDARYKDDPEWGKARDKVLPKLREKLKDDSLAKLIKEQVMKVDAPSDVELKKFYSANKELFTTPSRHRVSLIMLSVDPASTSEVWKQASDEAAAIVERINNGADFAELARIHSSDKSAADGGDMGFIHLGMLGENAQKVLDIMEPGEVSAPVVLLEGVAIFRLDERTKERLNDFEEVKERAEKLYLRNKGEEAWKELLVRLREDAVVEINDAPWR